MLPAITVLVITFKRPREIRQTLNALQENLIYAGEIKYLIADDSSGGAYLSDLARDYPHMRFSSTPHNMGWGGNANYHIEIIDTLNYLLVEDDQVLTRKLDLNPGVDLLRKNESVGMIRYGGLAGHVDMNFTLNEQALDVPFDQGLMYVPKYQYLEINPVGGGYAAFAYSNRPHLTHMRFHGSHGYYITGFKLGDTELEYTMRVRMNMQSNPSVPKIVVPIDWLTNHWRDIGTSFQHTEHDKGQTLNVG